MGGTSSKTLVQFTPAERQARAEQMVADITRNIKKVGVGSDVREHVDSHQAIYKLGGSTLHYVGEQGKKGSKAIQHGYVFKPAYCDLLESADINTSRSLLYMVPPPDRKKEKKIFYIAIPKKKAEQKAEEELFNQLTASDSGGGGGGSADASYAASTTDVGATEKKAAAPVAAAAPPKEVKKELRCPLCEIFATYMEDPWLSKCGHVACGECWTSWIEEQGDSAAICPECDDPVDPELLSKDVDIQKLIADYANQP